MSVLPQILRLIFGHKTQLALGIICMLFYAVFTVAPAAYMKDIVDALGSGKVPPIEKFYLVAFGIILVFFFKGLFFYGQSFLMAELGQKLIQELRNKLFRRILGMPISFFNKTQTGDLLTRFTTDLNYLNEGIRTGISGPLRDFPQILILLGLMLHRSWQLFLLILILLPIAAFTIQLFGQQNQEVTTKRQNKYGNLTSLIAEIISGIRVVKAFGMEPYEIKRFNKINERLYEYFLHSIRIGSYSYPILEFIGGICGALILTIGGYLIIDGQITGGDFASFIVAFFMMNEPIKKFNGFTLKIQEGHSAALRVYEIIDSNWQIEEVENPTKLKPIAESISIKIPSFSYQDRPVLKNIDISMKAGTVTALVGASGSGKTTLANLIPRFYDLKEGEGEICIDGMNIKQGSLDSLRGQIAIVTQEIVLFNDSIKANISYGDIDCDQETLENAAKDAFAHEFITSFENGYRQEVGEKGVMLSGGQRQRVAIARALIKDAPILILDEATSALDTESELEVQRAIENLVKDRTTLVIAHRLSTIYKADIIHVLKDGEIIESGTHKELLKADGEYNKLYQIQFKDQLQTVK